MHFIQVAPAASQSKPATPQVGYSALPASTPPPQQGTLPQTAQIPQPTPPQPQVQAAQATHPALYAQLQRSNPSQVSQAQIAAQARQQNGRATPQSAVHSRSPMVSAQALRNSPVVQSQPLASRSPMPNATALPQQIGQPTMLQPGMAQPIMTQATMAQTAPTPGDDASESAPHHCTNRSASNNGSGSLPRVVPLVASCRCGFPASSSASSHTREHRPTNAGWAATDDDAIRSVFSSVSARQTYTSSGRTFREACRTQSTGRYPVCSQVSRRRCR
ncbi:hypothetical protein EDD15DRAFT_1665929 [Pisolithus albus]|nr:hypothetical protein EDD15DRAFT_1665929 [Pisolithus albus]